MKFDRWTQRLTSFFIVIKMYGERERERKQLARQIVQKSCNFFLSVAKNELKGKQAFMTLS